jgi:hypothetical protein
LSYDEYFMKDIVLDECNGLDCKVRKESNYRNNPQDEE